jgi:hypothetical protein
MNDRQDAKPNMYQKMFHFQVICQRCIDTEHKRNNNYGL